MISEGFSLFSVPGVGVVVLHHLARFLPFLLLLPVLGFPARNEWFGISDTMKFVFTTLELACLFFLLSLFPFCSRLPFFSPFFLFFRNARRGKYCLLLVATAFLLLCLISPVSKGWTQIYAVVSICDEYHGLYLSV